MDLKNIDTFEIARNIYNKCCDMDFRDYEENKEQEISEIENALYFLKTVAQNKYNKDYFETFLIALATIFQEN